MLDVQLPGLNKMWTVGFVAADTTLVKVLVDVTPAELIAVLAGETALPGEASVRQQILRGGCRVVGGSIASTDGTARSVTLWKGKQASLQSNFGATSTITGTNTVNRAIGSFITDGWRTGDAAFPFGALTAGNNGAVGIVTAVTALTLTVNGAPWTNETIPAGGRLIKASQWTRRGVPINSGNTDTAAAVVLLGGTQDPAQAFTPDAGEMLGPDDMILAGMVAATSALPAAVTIVAHSVRY